jgi:phospholipase/lecithinase/hemolysin
MYATDDRSDYDPRTGCLKKFNSVALYHNAMLRIALDQLQRRRPEARIIYADYYTPYIQFARTPHLYGTLSHLLLPVVHSTPMALLCSSLLLR